MDNEQHKTINNSLSGLVGGLGINQPFGTAQNSQADSLYYNNRYYLVSNMRQLLSQLYVEHGLVQTLVDMPVDDAFAKGLIITSEQLDDDDIAELNNFLEEKRIIETIKQTMKWSRLFGGAGLVINTDQDPTKPLVIENINQDSNLDFYSADLWELQYQASMKDGRNPSLLVDSSDVPYIYYDQPLHTSRVLRVQGKEAPSFVRPRLRGWGMSEVERFVRSINSYLKNQDVVFELLDEAKIDIYKIDGFNTSLATQNGTNALQSRIESANTIKNYLNALTMDALDDYEQKQITFAGLGDMLVQNRQGVASDLRMPLTKLFGVSAAGFNAGEDDIENYNSMIESEIRSKSNYLIIPILKICCQKIFGFAPDLIRPEFKPLRQLSAEQEENVKNSKLSRLMTLFDRGIIAEEELRQAINQEHIISIGL